MCHVCIPKYILHDFKIQFQMKPEASWYLYFFEISPPFNIWTCNVVFLCCRPTISKIVVVYTQPNNFNLKFQRTIILINFSVTFAYSSSRSVEYKLDCNILLLNSCLGHFQKDLKRRQFCVMTIEVLLKVFKLFGRIEERQKENSLHFEMQLVLYKRSRGINSRQTVV